MQSKWSPSPDGKFGNITAKKFGRLLVRRFVGIRRGRRHWLCKCDCGQTSEVDTTSLRLGTTKSCGCYQRELQAQMKDRLRGVSGVRHPSWRGGITFTNATIRSIKRSALKRAYQWRLTNDEVLRLFQSNCFYCGCPPSNTRNDPSYKGVIKPFRYNGLDRIDNNKSYTRDNVVACCNKCNYSKKHLSLKEWYSLLTKVRKTLKATIKQGAKSFLDTTEELRP